MGALQVQGTINSYGELCGNANLCTVIPSIELKLNLACIGREKLSELMEISRYVSEWQTSFTITDSPTWGRAPLPTREERTWMGL